MRLWFEGIILKKEGGREAFGKLNVKPEHI